MVFIDDCVVRVQTGEVKEAVRAIRRNGFVIVKQAITIEPLQVLRERMDSDTIELLEYCESLGGNPRERGHLQQGPPVSSDFVFSEVAMNPHVNAICVELFGGKPRLTFYNGNTNCPGSVEQHLHMDGEHSTQPPEPVAPISSVVVNVPPGPMTLDNGAIQLWPGSHLVRTKRPDQGIDKQTIEARRKLAPPIRAKTEVGDVLVRDVRLWHRGVPNLSDRPRHMIALVVSSQATRYPLRFEKGCEAKLEGHQVDSQCRLPRGKNRLFDPTNPPILRAGSESQSGESRQIMRVQCKVFLLVGCLMAMDSIGQVPNEVETWGIPDIPDELTTAVERYENVRSAGLVDWVGDSLLIQTRFAETTQLHIVEQPLGMRRQITFFDEPVAGTEVPPQVNPIKFVYNMDAGGSESYQIYQFDLATHEIELLSDGRSRYTDVSFDPQGSAIAYTTTERNGVDWDLHIRGVDGTKEIVQENQGVGWSVVDWHPTGEKVLVSRYISTVEQQLYEIDLNTLIRTQLLRDRGKIAIRSATYSADGKTVYLLSDLGGEYRSLYRVDLDTNRLTQLVTGVNWDLTGIRMSRSRKSLTYIVNAGGYSQLYLLDLESGEARGLKLPDRGIVGSVRFSPKRPWLIAYSFRSATSPGDVYVLDTQTDQIVRWTESELGGLVQGNLVKPDLVSYASFDGLEIPAFVYKPKSAGPHPVLIYIHGGPASQYRPSFSESFQLYVNELGMAVVAPNVRGSSGYGRTYVSMDDGYRREDSVKDIGALLDWIDTQDDFDQGRVAVYGGSYGGYMVLACLMHFGDRIQVASERVGISNFVTFLENTQGYRRDLRRVEYGDERDPSMRRFLESIAPLNNVDKIKNPMLIGQGLNDPRVPASESRQIVEALRLQSVPVWYVVANNEGHGFRKKANRDYWLRVFTLFFQTYLIGANGGSADTTP